MSYRRKRVYTLVGLDSCIVFTSIFFSRLVVYNTFDIVTFPVVVSALTLLGSHHLVSIIYKLYRKAWEYAGIGELISIFKVVFISILVTAFAQVVFFHEVFSRLLLVTALLHMSLIGGSRFLWRIYGDRVTNENRERRRTLIVGAGSAGIMVARQLLHNHEAELLPVGFIDDDLKKQRLDIIGIPVLGGVDSISAKVKELDIENIVIAIPSLSKRELTTIFRECTKSKAKTKILPRLEDLMTGKLSVNQVREVQVEDLLGREPVKLDTEGIGETLSGRVVLVTGAGGSIGSEICRQVSRFKPAKLILLGHGENSIYNIEMELKRLSDTIEILTEIADVQDREKMVAVMEHHHPDVVYHAAAHKHVPLMERHPEQAVKNNVIGTKNVAEAASDANVSTFVMVSTDKAVNPTSVMGATKRLAEMIIQNIDRISRTRFVVVRFGNVLGSRGSVIPLFKKQIEQGGPVTVTHPDMVRFFMTIPEASRLVIQAGALAKGGEIFILDMGDPVRIVDLAMNMIKLSNYSIDDVGIEFTGVRPGEKLVEELMNQHEQNEKQIYPKIYIGKSNHQNINPLIEFIQNFETMDYHHIRNVVIEMAQGKQQIEKVLSFSN